MYDNFDNGRHPLPLQFYAVLFTEKGKDKLLMKIPDIVVAWLILSKFSVLNPHQRWILVALGQSFKFKHVKH